MAVTDKVKAMLSLKGKKVGDLAVHFEMSSQAMRNKMHRGSFSAEDLIKIADFLEAELIFKMSDNQNIVLDKDDLRNVEN